MIEAAFDREKDAIRYVRALWRCNVKNSHITNIAINQRHFVKMVKLCKNFLTVMLTVFIADDLNELVTCASFLRDSTE